jgi:hypothetical protein|tara:strand:- start:599 stop:1234 length:636 start_codon:yes stop_codon:yes gene_type:complete
MNKMLKNITLVVTALALGACSTNTYKIKSENGKVLNKVPEWYMADIAEKKACDLKIFDTKDNEKQCIFGVATAVSPDLQLAIEKAKMLAKSELADIIKGEMNKQSKQFITELGKTETKTVVTEVESTLINIIKNTPVRGYEIFEQDVTLTDKGYYRAWVGLRLPLGDFNKMYDYNIDQAVDAHNIKLQSDNAYNELLSKVDDGKNENTNIQ